MRPTSLALLPLALLVTEGPTLSAVLPGGTVEAQGACDIRPDGVACWDTDGAPSPALVEAVRNALARSGGDVQFRLGRKNRYLAVRHPQGVNANYRALGSESVYGNFRTEGEPAMEFMRVSVEPSVSSIVLQAQASVPADKDVDLSLREGSRATVDGWDVEVGAAQRVVVKKGTVPNPRRNFGYGPPPPGMDYWMVVIGLKGRENVYPQWALTPLDAEGQPIRYLDAAGRPISALKALALEPTLQPTNGYSPNNGEEPAAKKPKAMAAYFTGNGPAPAFRASTNIDPKAISTLRIRPSRTVSVDLGPFPLDPK